MKKQIVVIHGGETFDTYEEYLEALRGKSLDFERAQKKFWKDTLAEKLGSDYEVIAPRMPNAAHAKYLEWKIWFEKYIPFLRDDVILAGHSLGGIFLAKYLAENIFPKKILGTLLLAAPYGAGDPPDSLTDFVLPESVSQFEKQGGVIYLFQSKDDPVVPYEDVLAYQKMVPSASQVIFEDKQHFSIEEFPELIEKIKGLS